MTDTKTMPPLGAGSVDLSALHAADKRNADLTEAVEKARVAVVQREAPDAPAEPEAPAAKPAATDKP